MIVSDFNKSGAGEYSVELSDLPTIVNDDGTSQDYYATVGNTAKVKLSGDLPASRVHDKRAGFRGCSANQQSQITTAISSAQSYARDAFSYTSGVSSATPDTPPGSVPTPLFAERWSTTTSRISRNNFSDFKYECTCTSPNFAHVSAYIFQLFPGL